jgi:pimeloyl-ACP methyl ester carboxylesterase
MPDTRTDRTVVLLHGWPGLPSDYDEVVRHLDRSARVIVPDLLGFGSGYLGPVQTADATAEAHAERLLRELDSRGVDRGVVIAGYDIGSRIAQAALRRDPTRFDGAVLTPAYPGIGDRAASPDLAPVFWYQHFHRSPIAAQLIDGDVDAVRQYTGYIWQSWRAHTSAAAPPNRDDVVAAYVRPGAFGASLEWYSANRGYGSDVRSIPQPTTMLWPDSDPLFPLEWADELPNHFDDVRLEIVQDCGHFLPIERPDAVASALRRHLERPGSSV